MTDELYTESADRLRLTVLTGLAPPPNSTRLLLRIQFVFSRLGSNEEMS